MFQDVVLGSVGFKSRCTKKTASVAALTDAVATAESSTEPLFGFVDNATQTEPKAAGASGASAKGKDAKTTAESEEEETRAIAFVRRVGPTMLREMATSAATSGYFRGFEKYLEESAEKTVSKLFLLKFDYDAYFRAPQTQAESKDKSRKVDPPLPTGSLKLSCTGVSWNATGASIAIAYGRFDHSGWCNYRSALCLWSVFQSDFNPLKPNLVLETSSGLMCVAYHPKNPSVVAAGSFNGEVFVWDTEPDEYRFYSSGIGDYFHREPVTSVAWVYDVQAAEYNVASVSGDGKVLFWRLKDKLAYPVEGYVMHLPANTKGGSSSSSSGAGAGAAVTPNAARGHVIGGKTLGFSAGDKTSRSFVVGSEGGAVTRCFSKGVTRAADFKGDKKWTATAARLVGKLPAPRLPAVRRQVEQHATERKAKEITLAMVYDAKLDPAALYPSAMDFSFERHGGPVYAVRFSPFRKSLFLTCSSDGTARVYSSLQKEPVASLEVTPSSAYLYAAEWSRTRPMVFAVAAEDGHVYVYDLKADRANPVLVLSSSSSSDAQPSTSSVSSVSSSSGGERASRFATPMAAKAPGSPVFSLDFNPRQRNFLAAGDASGAVHIWKLPWHLATFQSGEAGMLEALEAAES
ncbi:hypothetical protein PybrP1_005606 [[Pythium] brassicae (nom. inval.)]|nr:hypothetical protein PybrP1_005606 [[Pythium] brassicae (nom. inval.)]